MIEAKELVHVFPDGTVGLHFTNLSFATNSRVLLIGANGAGKSTLLRILAGKTLAKAGMIQINGQDPFRDGIAGITYLGTEWATNPIVRHDIPVTLLLSSIGGDNYPDRRDLLIDILDIDIRWRLHQVSDGERRRVQLAMGLLKPWNILLLDEVTVDLDVLVRARLLEFLKNETETRQCQVIYATHIFDGLANWPTELAHMHLGKIITVESYNSNMNLLQLALNWLTKDLEDRGIRKEKIKWQDIEQQAMDHGPLEKNKEGGFEKYFKASRGRT